MPPMWYQLIKILVLLFALFTTIVCINSEISKRREAEAAAATAAATLAAVEAAAGRPKLNPSTDMSDFMSDNLLHILRSKAKEHQGKEHQEAADRVDHPELQPAELPAKDLNQTINDIFKVYDAPGVHIFNTTTTDYAPLMPIHTMIDQSQPQPQQQTQPQPQATPSHYHQYHSLSQQDQYFKGTNPATVTMPDQQGEAQRTRQPPENPIVFPDSAVMHQMRTPEPPLIKRDIPQCVEDQDNHKSKSFCTEVQNYPDLSRIKGKLSQNFSNFFSDPEPVPMDISSRLGPNDEVFLCRSHRRYLYPKSGLKSDNTWQFIVNNEEFKQGILIEECENEDMPCDYSSSFPQRYKPICKQHYVMRMLASIRNTSGEELDVAQESFKIPSCCKCVLKVL
ncbi:protein spaetzle isoform X4 [Drosophila guanche]|uniref:Blast:Protein spaetzle n=1 Tax=Drosophila guanche TaxID=7266 RepID=A0A3B0JEM6_DROGU|nr:protein spaetzle isoform X4 [Drosophila guanche]SPP80555.1 blast:Protein spaetzle [Drosophila guanche]